MFGSLVFDRKAGFFIGGLFGGGRGLVVGYAGGFALFVRGEFSGFRGGFGFLFALGVRVFGVPVFEFLVRWVNFMNLYLGDYGKVHHLPRRPISFSWW